MSSLQALCSSYAVHAGLRAPHANIPAELRRRLALWPLWARLLVRPCAFAMRWAAPLLLTGRVCRFEDLTPADKDALLTRLQGARRPLLRGAFLLVKSAVLTTCYGSEPGRRP